MKLLLSIFLMFILVSSATLTNFAFAYEKENHYWLKIALALNCGFTLDEARLIGIGDFSIDEDPDTQPVRSGSDKDNAKWKWHALPTENPDVDKNEVSKGNQEIKQRQHELYDRAMNEKDTPMKLFKFGQYLHYQEDKWSHWGYTTGMGHAVPNVVPGMDSPDETHANPEHYRYMVFDSMVNLGKLAKSLGKDTECVSALVPLDTYKSAPEYGKDFPWFSPQEIKRSKDPLKFQKDVSKHLSDWKKSALIDEVITVSDKKGDDGVTDSFISYIAKHTGKSKSDITKKYDYSHIEIDEKGNAKTIPENLVKSVKVKEEKNSKKTTDKTKNDTIKKTPVKKTEQKKTGEKSSDEISIIKAYSIATMMASSVKKPADIDVLKQVKKELTTQEYRSLVEFLNSRMIEMRSSDVEPLKKPSSITDKERARVLVEISNEADVAPKIFNESKETPSKDGKNQKQPSFEISLKPDSMSLPTGGYGEVDVTVKSLNGWNERVWLNIPIPIGPIRYPTMVPKLVTPTPDSDAVSAFAVDVSQFACPGKYRMAVYGMSQDRFPMEIKYTYFNLEIIGPDKFFDLGTDQKTITIQKGGSKSFGLVAKNLDKTDHGYLVDTVDNFKAPPGVTVDYKTFMHTKVGETSKNTITIKTSESVKTPLTFTLPMRAQTALNCDPTPTGVANVVVHIVGQEDSTPENILIPGSTETKPVEPKQTNTKPALTIPKQITQEATSSAGASVNYNVSGQDKEDGAITPSCSYPSGYTFPIGATTVSCTVDDSDNNSVSGTFTVTVRDTTPPDIPKFQPTEGVRDETGVQVFFEVTAFDLVDGSVSASCNYPSGYKFPIGTTVLTCTADDSRGNHASRSLQITITITESGQ